MSFPVQFHRRSPDLSVHAERRSKMRRAQIGRIAIAAWFIALWILAAAACLLSGCLTAAKIHRWESALLGWARKGSPECVDAAKVASKYLVNAHRTLSGATSALDVATDGEAKKIMTEAAQKCGQVVP